MKMEGLDVLIVLLCTAAMITMMFLAFGCSSTCKRKLCCPEEGHGPCPICTDVIFDSEDIIYGRKR